MNDQHAALLAHALELLRDHMCSRSDEYSPEDWETLEYLEGLT